MTTPFHYDTVGLGISFEPHLHQKPEPRISNLQNDFSEPRYAQVKPMISLRTRGLQFEHNNHHQRAQSAIIPQRSTFENMPLGDRYQAPRSAHPVQRPFTSPTTSMYAPGYVHSAPTTPNENQSMHLPYRSMTDRRDVPRETVYDRRQQRRLPLDNRPPPRYFNSPRYVESSMDGYPGTDFSNSGSSYFQMTPSVQSTPLSDSSSAFPVPDHFDQGYYPTPQLMGSPIFDHYQGRLGHFDGQDDMPEEPYVPTVLTNFPPLRPSALRRGTTEDSKHTAFSSHDEAHSLFNSPASSPPTDHLCQQKDRKVAYARWTATEDQLLKEAIAIYGDSKWSLVANMVPGRTPMQCSTRWQGALNTSIHKGRWDPEEDAILIQAVGEWQAWHVVDSKDDQNQDDVQEDLYKAIPWASIAALLPRSRTGVQALARWSEALDPRITKGKWTAEEDAALLRGISKYGSRWIKIANCVKGRTQRQCRTRFCQISDKKRKVRGGPIEQMSRHASPDVNFSE